MPTFQYTAVTSEGTEVSGSTEAQDSRNAAATLRSQSLFVVKLKPSGGKEAGSDGAVTQPISNSNGGWLGRILPVISIDQVLFLRQLALMQRSGLSLLQSLDVCSTQTNKWALASSIRRVMAAVQAGKSLSEGLAAQRRRFSPLTIQLVRCAEASGELDIALERAAQQIERHAEIRSQVITSLIYPSIVVFSSIAVAAMLVIKVIPKFAAFFARRGGQLPWATQLLVDLSGHVSRWWPTAAMILGVIAALFIVLCISPGGRLFLHRAVLRVPIIGSLLMAGLMTRFTQTLATLLESGVTLIESLRIVKEVTGNRAVSRAIMQAEQRILEGHNLAFGLQDLAIPSLVVQAISVGERTGSLGQVLTELCGYYDSLLQRKIRRMSAMIEPVMILIIGLLVGFVYFAFFQAVMQLATAGR